VRGSAFLRGGLWAWASGQGPARLVESRWWEWIEDLDVCGSLAPRTRRLYSVGGSGALLQIAVVGMGWKPRRVRASCGAESSRVLTGSLRPALTDCGGGDGAGLSPCSNRSVFGRVLVVVVRVGSRSGVLVRRR